MSLEKLLVTELDEEFFAVELDSGDEILDELEGVVLSVAFEELSSQAERTAIKMQNSEK